MKALVIYESMFGNTEAVARTVAEGLSGRFEVTVSDVRTAPPARDADLIVVGGPTHAFGLSRPGTRQDAVRQGAAGDATIGLREWLSTVTELTGVQAAAFDTRMDKPLVGSAARKAHRMLRRLGCRMVMPAESFFVTGTAGPLAGGEQQRARRWGEALAASVRVTARF